MAVFTPAMLTQSKYVALLLQEWAWIGLLESAGRSAQRTNQAAIAVQQGATAAGAEDL